MIRNIKRRIAHIGKIEVRKSQSTITVTPKDEFFDMDAAVDIIKKVFATVQS